MASWADTGIGLPAMGPTTTAASKPAHINGRVMLSGSNWWSISMPVRAIKAQVTSNPQAAGAPKPKCQATHAESRAVASSTRGYRAEILVLQEAQRPRSTSQLTTGMFCQALMGALQTGQAERGVLKVSRSGTAAWGAELVDAVSWAGGSNSAAWARQSRSSMMGRR